MSRSQKMRYFGFTKINHLLSTLEINSHSAIRQINVSRFEISQRAAAQQRNSV